MLKNLLVFCSLLSFEIMIRNKWPGVRLNEGKECFRINSVYMYIIKPNGSVAALVGHKIFTVTTIEPRDDKGGIMAFMRVGKWIYPLAKFLSPILITDQSSIIMPDPFENQQYIAIKLHESIKLLDKKILQSLLSTYSHLIGQFQQQRSRSKSTDAPYIFEDTTKTIIYSSNKSKVDLNKLTPKVKEILKSNYQDGLDLRQRQIPTYRYRSKSMNIPKCLRPYNKHLFRLYTYGPTDPIFFKIEMNPACVKIHFLIFKALKMATEMLEKRNNYWKNMGFTINFDRRFDQYNQCVAPNDRIPIPEDDLLWASFIFENNLEKRNFTLVNFESPEEKTPIMVANKELDSALIVRILISQYCDSESFFGTLITLSEIETFRFTKSEKVRLIEKCDHKKHPYYKCYADSLFT